MPIIDGLEIDKKLANHWLTSILRPLLAKPQIRAYISDEIGPIYHAVAYEVATSSSPPSQVHVQMQLEVRNKIWWIGSHAKPSASNTDKLINNSPYPVVVLRRGGAKKVWILRRNIQPMRNWRYEVSVSIYYLAA